MTPQRAAYQNRGNTFTVELRTACMQAAIWRDDRRHGSVSIRFWGLHMVRAEPPEAGTRRAIDSLPCSILAHGMWHS